MEIPGYFTIFVGIGMLLSVALTIFAIGQRATDKSFFLTFLSIGTFLYTFGYLLELCAPTLESAFYGVRVQYVGLPFIMPLFYLFMRDIYGRRRFRPAALLLFLAAPTLFLLAMQAYPLSTLFYRDIEYVTGGPLANVHITPGVLYYVSIAHTCVYFLLVIALILRHIIRKKLVMQRQSFILLLAVLLQFTGSIPYFLSVSGLAQVFGEGEMRLDFGPFVSAVTLALLFYSVWYQNLLRIVPMARAQVIEAMEDAFVVCNSNYVFLDANQAAKDLFPEIAQMEAGDPLWAVPKFQLEGELQFQRGGETKFYQATQTKIILNKRSSGYCIVFHDITEKENLLKELHTQATFDPLMHIYNRGTFFKMAHFATSAEKNGNRPFALFMIDIDHFKLVNDTYGHLCGDRVLEAVASLVRSHFRKDDIVGRYGGEEISVLLENVSAERALELAERLRESIENHPIAFQGRVVRVTISIGMTHAPAGATLTDLLWQADTALYAAKESGRNRTCVYRGERSRQASFRKQLPKS